MFYEVKFMKEGEGAELFVSLLRFRSRLWGLLLFSNNRPLLIRSTSVTRLVLDKR